MKSRNLFYSADLSRLITSVDANPFTKNDGNFTLRYFFREGRGTYAFVDSHMYSVERKAIGIVNSSKNKKSLLQGEKS